MLCGLKRAAIFRLGAHFFLVATTCELFGCSKPNPSVENSDFETADPFVRPSIEDTTAFIAWYDARFDFHGPEIGLFNCGTRSGFMPITEILVYSDTVFDLSEIDPRMTGQLAFDWEPLEYDDESEDGWNMHGVHAFTVQHAGSEPYVQDLEELLSVEAWHFNQGQVTDAKEVYFTDINLDGYLDMRMLQSVGKSASDCYFLYHPDSGNFSLQILEHVKHPSLDCNMRLLTTYLGGTGGGASFRTSEIDSAGRIAPVMDVHSYFREGCRFRSHLTPLFRSN